MTFNLKQAMAANARELEKIIDRLLSPGLGPEHRVLEAMRYSALSGGKRIRPFLVMSCANLFSVSKKLALRTAAAIELVHCYSLIHDDLPSMDNDELRRGRSTCHIEFDEATAILAGDALLTKAFEVLADPKTHRDAMVRADLVLAIAKASGHAGMVGGQILDLEAEEIRLNLAEIKQLQRMKTGALIAVSCDAGAILGKASANARKNLQEYAYDLGLAFQITDDLLDAEGDERIVGKKTGKDGSAGKATFVSLLGVEGAREQAEILARKAQEKLLFFGEQAKPLHALSHFVVNRSS